MLEGAHTVVVHMHVCHVQCWCTCMFVGQCPCRLSSTVYVHLCDVHTTFVPCMCAHAVFVPLCGVCVCMCATFVPLCICLCIQCLPLRACVYAHSVCALLCLCM